MGRGHASKIKNLQCPHQLDLWQWICVYTSRALR